MWVSWSEVLSAYRERNHQNLRYFFIDLDVFGLWWVVWCHFWQRWLHNLWIELYGWLIIIFLINRRDLVSEVDNLGLRYGRGRWKCFLICYPWSHLNFFGPWWWFSFGLCVRFQWWRGSYAFCWYRWIFFIFFLFSRFLLLIFDLLVIVNVLEALFVVFSGRGWRVLLSFFKFICASECCLLIVVCFGSITNFFRVLTFRCRSLTCHWLPLIFRLFFLYYRNLILTFYSPFSHLYRSTDILNS